MGEGGTCLLKKNERARQGGRGQEETKRTGKQAEKGKTCACRTFTHLYYIVHFIVLLHCCPLFCFCTADVGIFVRGGRGTTAHAVFDLIPLHFWHSISSLTSTTTTFYINLAPFLPSLFQVIYYSPDPSLCVPPSQSFTFGWFGLGLLFWR